MKKKSHNNISMSIVGDFCPSRSLQAKLLSGIVDETDMLLGIKQLFMQRDLAIVNLENPFTLENAAILKNGPCLQSHPDTISLLSYLGIKLVTMATNHIRDFAEKGVRDTLYVCSKAGIDTVGAGVTLDAARRVYYRNTKGRTVAIINCAENEFSNATPIRGGANPLDLLFLISDIRDARSKADHVLLILHGGLEYVHYPSPQSMRMLRFLAEQGLTAIIRHHPHYVQGIEIWKEVPIFYSIGNFLSDTINRSRAGWFEGIVVTLEISPDDRCAYKVHPFRQCSEKAGVELMEGTEKKLFLERLDRYSKVILDPEKHEQKWHAILNERRQAYFGLLTLPSHFLFRIFRKLNLLRYIKPTRRKRLLWENYLRCEAHREILIDILEQDLK